MTPDDPVAALRNLASALSECDECQAPTINDTDGPNSLCGKCWARHEALSAEVDRLKADIAAWPVCDEHKPGRWDSGETCVVCEAHEEHAELERLRAALATAQRIGGNAVGQVAYMTSEIAAVLGLSGLTPSDAVGAVRSLMRMAEAERKSHAKTRRANDGAAIVECRCSAPTDFGDHVCADCGRPVTAKGGV